MSVSGKLQYLFKGTAIIQSATEAATGLSIILPVILKYRMLQGRDMIEPLPNLILIECLKSFANSSCC